RGSHGVRRRACDGVVSGAIRTTLDRGARRRRKSRKMTTTDISAKQAFGERLFGDGLGRFNLAGIDLGETLGLYEAMRHEVSLTSTELAARASIDERYAREWLEQQAANGVLTLAEPADDPAARRFLLPRAHAEVLADREDLDFMAWVGLSGVASFARLPDVA